MVTTEQLTKRLDNLKAQYQQAINDANAVSGAIQVVESLIQESTTADGEQAKADTAQKE